MSVESYRDLLVWKQAFDPAASCHRATALFPKSEVYGVASQVRRSASSVPANIAEGYGRESTRAYIHFPRTAQGSLKELETHLLLAAEVSIPDSGAIQPLLVKCESVGKLLRLLIRSLEKKQEDDGKG